MAHQDAEVSEIVVVIHASYADRLNDAVEKLKTAGVEIFSTDEDEGIVSGCIEAYKAPSLEKLECVNYVRTVLTYIADYPVGDPRDRDLKEDDDEDTAEAV
jgi:hypothetical protein